MVILYIYGFSLRSRPLGIPTRPDIAYGAGCRVLVQKMPGFAWKPLREWHGETHTVIVTEDGFEWRGQPHGSLSVIARAITGTRWSGPRFFGLTKKPKANQEHANG